MDREELISKVEDLVVFAVEKLLLIADGDELGFTFADGRT